MEKTILLIEDDTNILDMMSMILTDEGFEVISKEKSVSIAFIMNLKPAAILMDSRLEESMGQDLCLEIKNNTSTKDIPVILVSAVRDLAKIAKESCADAYLAKPFDLSELVGIVRRFTDSELII